METKGKINCYTCLSCEYKHYTINLCEGVTPFYVICKKCAKLASSNFYILSEKTVIVKYCWFRPLIEHFKNLDEYTKEYILRGGLLLAELKNPVYLDEEPIEPFDQWIKEKYRLN